MREQGAIQRFPNSLIELAMRVGRKRDAAVQAEGSGVWAEIPLEACVLGVTWQLRNYLCLPT